MTCTTSSGLRQFTFPGPGCVVRKLSLCILMAVDAPLPGKSGGFPTVDIRSSSSPMLYFSGPMEAS